MVKYKERKRLRILGKVLFVCYVLFIIYFLLFSEWYGRTGEMSEYRYNLVLFKEIRRFILYRDILGWRAVFLNIFGNVLAFMPFGFFLPVIWVRTRHWYITVLLSFAMSLLVETMQLVGKVGSFDVDDLILNTLGGVIGYLLFWICNKIRRKIYG
jgi:glycopeptide antibiotics resistance protein